MSRSRGTARERSLRRKLEARGWVTIRTAGSRGVMDVIALKPGRVVFIQVKSDEAGPFAHFYPDERTALAETGLRAGAEVWLVWWPPDRQGPRWIGPDEWPVLGRRGPAPADRGVAAGDVPDPARPRAVGGGGLAASEHPLTEVRGAVLRFDR